MHRIFFIFILLEWPLFIAAQTGQNPFDLGSPDPISEDIFDQPTISPPANTNPFDLENNTPSAIIEPVESAASLTKKPSTDNPFDLGTSSYPIQKQVSPPPPSTPQATNKPVQQKTDTASHSDGWILSLTLFMLALATFIFIFFRSLYTKIYKAILNNNQLNLLFRERTGGVIGRYYIAYALFFLSASWFIYLSLLQSELIPNGTTLKQYSLITASFTGLFIAKHVILGIIGYVFPIQKEIRIYSFSIMIFAILIGILMPIAGFILAYSSPASKSSIIYFVGGGIFIIYLLRSLRGLFIANRFIFNYSYHFLLYLCAVEIAPILILYKIISTI